MKNKRYFSIFILIILIIGMFIPMATATTVKKDFSGVYKIRAAVGSNMYLDIDAGSKENGANLQIWEKSNVAQQEFIITKIDEQYYKIESKNSGKVIDVENADKENNANVWQYENNGTDAQQWLIKEDDAKNGYCNIVSKLSGKYLDVQNAESNNGTNVQVYENDGNMAQKFVLEKVGQEQPKEPSVKPSTDPNKDDLDGTYKIKVGVGSNMYLDIDQGSKEPGANVQIWQNSDVEQQQFKVTKLKDGYYKILAVHSGCSLDVNNAGKENGTNVKQYLDTGGDAQEWKIEKIAGTNKYKIISKCNGLSLDVYGGESANGTNVQMYKDNESDAQKFEFEEITKPSAEPSTEPSVKPSTEPSVNTEEIKPQHTIDDGTYKIKSVAKNNMVIDVSEGGKEDGKNVQIWEDCEKKNQKFHIRDLGDGYYSIKAVHSKKSLDVDNGGTVKGTNVKQYEYRDNNDAQEWIIHEIGNTKQYNIISKCNNLCLDIYDGKTENGTNIQMWELNGTDAQKFTFEKTEYQEIDDGMYEIQTTTSSDEILGIANESTELGARLQVQDRISSNSQKFNVKYNSDKTYTISPVHSGQALDVKDYGTENGTPVQQYEQYGNEAQKWKIKDLEDGTYNIVSECGGLYLDIYNGEISNGTPMQTWEGNGTKAQLFKFVETEKSYNDSQSFSMLDDARYSGFKSGLQQVKNAHPNWNIRIYYTGITWDEALDAQEVGTRSLTQATGNWRKSNVGYDVSKSWYLATRAAIAYMMDPRNSFDGYIFQFQDLASSSGTYSDIQKMVSGYSYLNNPSCINAILQAAQQNGISPFHIASRIMQECGKGGGSMYGYTYNGTKVYNLYNINVSGNDGSGLVRGAQYAYDRGWFTPEASIIGGASFLKTNYIAVGQSTLYFQKYNVVNKNYSHQYMQNIRAANDEGYSMYKTFRDNGLLESHFTFVIPVYENMPSSPCARPST